MWGDSGLYYCIITTPDDLEGKNEDSVELLVLGEWRREHLSCWPVPPLGPLHTALILYTLTKRFGCPAFLPSRFLVAMACYLAMS